MVTLKDIARRAGVSPMTVSRVVNGSTVRSENRRKVEQAMQDLSFFPNHVAKSFRSGRTKTIGLIVPSIITPLFTHIARGVEDSLNQAGYKMMLSTHADNIERERQYINSLIASRVDGVIVAPADEASKSSLELLRSNDISFVLIDRNMDTMASDYIIGDNFQSSCRLTEFLLSRGHERIAIITGQHSVYTSGVRFRAFQSTMASRGLPLPAELVRTIIPDTELDNLLEQISTIVRELLALPNPPTALVAYSDLVAIQTLNILDELGLGYPNDLDMVCFEDVAPLGGLKPRIPAAVQPALKIGRMAFEMLMKRIQDPDRPYEPMILEPEYNFKKDIDDDQSPD